MPTNIHGTNMKGKKSIFVSVKRTRLHAVLITTETLKRSPAYVSKMSILIRTDSLSI